MDGSKRKASDLPSKDFTNMYFGFTPPHTLPASLHQESALRYTQAPESYPRNPASFPPLPGLDSVSCVSNGAPNHGHRTQEPPAGRETFEPQRHDSIGAGNIVTDKDNNDDDDNDNDDDDASVHVDTHDGTDELYTINAEASSWSGTLASEDEPGAPTELPFQAILAMQHLKRPQELAAETQRVKVANAAVELLLPGQGGSSEEHANVAADYWKQDLILRTTIRRIKQSLEKGATLTINNLPSHVLTPCCSYPFCPEENKTIAPGTYYLTLHEPHDTSVHYCLSCLEDLWNGSRLISPLPAAQVQSDETQRKQELIFNLDGEWAPQSLLSSKHAPAHLKTAEKQRSPLQRPTPSPRTLHIATDTAPPSPPAQSPRSTTSTGEWLQPPTRFQHLAGFIIPGGGLDEAEKAAVEAWKAASEEQINWIGLREKYRRTVEELTCENIEETYELTISTPMNENEPADHVARGGTGSGSHGSGRTGSHQQGVVQHVDAGMGEGEMESHHDSVPKLRVLKQCRGQNLSAVLARLSNA